MWGLFCFCLLTFLTTVLSTGWRMYPNSAYVRVRSWWDVRSTRQRRCLCGKECSWMTSQPPSPKEVPMPTAGLPFQLEIGGAHRGALPLGLEASHGLPSLPSSDVTSLENHILSYQNTCECLSEIESTWGFAPLSSHTLTIFQTR